MSLPAIIIHDEPTAPYAVAGVSLLDRLVVCAHRAGCAPIQIVGQPSPRELARTRALGIPFQSTARLQAISTRTLVARSSALAHTVDLRALMRGPSRLVAADDSTLPVGVVDAAGADQLFKALQAQPPIKAQGVAARVTDRASAREAERALWASLTSAADGLVDRYFNRPVGRVLSRRLVHTAVTPNQVSVVATLIGLLSAWCLAGGSYVQGVMGALLLQLSAIIDCIDGDLARAAFKESPWGKWLDIVGDQVVHVAVFVAIGVGLWRADVDGPVALLAASAGLGVVLAFGVVLRGMLRPETRHTARWQRFLDATTNRDFSVVLLALAVANGLELFLWACAVGVHVYWITAWVIQGTGRDAVVRASQPRRREKGA